MGRPARMPEAGGRPRVVSARGELQLLEVADGADVVERAVLEKGDPRGVVSAVLEPFQSSEEKWLGGSRADVSDDSAHLCGPLPGIEGSKTPPENNEARPRPCVGSVSRALVERESR